MFQFGFNTGVKLSDKLSDSTVSLLLAIAVWAALVRGMIGGLSARYLADYFGRKKGFYTLSRLSVSGCVLMGCASQPTAMNTSGVHMYNSTLLKYNSY